MHKGCGCYELLKAREFEAPAEVSGKRSIGSISSEYAVIHPQSAASTNGAFNARFPPGVSAASQKRRS
jgi:hypothetical protein